MVPTEPDIDDSHQDDDPWILSRSIALLFLTVACVVLIPNPYFLGGPVTKGIAIWFSVTSLMTVIFSAFAARRPSNVRRSSAGNLIVTLTQGFVCALPLSVLVFIYLVGLPPSWSASYWFIAGLLALLSIVAAGHFVTTGSARGSRLAATQTFLAMLLAGLAVAWTNAQAAHAIAAMAESVPLKWDTSPCDGGRRPYFAHISDLHLVERDGHKTYDGSEPGNQRLPELLASIGRAHPAYLLISGDITDRGLAGEWRRALDDLAPIARTMPVILAPGNHDLSNAFEGDLTDVTPASRLQRFLTAQAQLFGDLSTATGITMTELVAKAPRLDDQDVQAAEKRLNDCNRECVGPLLPVISPPPGGTGDKLLDSQNEWTRRAAECARLCETRLSADNTLVTQRMGDVPTYWREAHEHAFPLSFIDVSTESAVFSLMLEPAPGPQGLGNNAIGYLDDGQMKRLESKIEALPASVTTVVVMTHHPVTRAPGDTANVPSLSLLKLSAFVSDLYNSQWWNYAFLRADPAEMNMLTTWMRDRADRDRNRSFIVVFGHRHQRSLGAVGNVLIIEAPNVATTRDPGFYLVANAQQQTRSVFLCNP
jgi:3',5'-cyclic AMP phosphodiesterase CpdA